MTSKAPSPSNASPALDSQAALEIELSLRRKLSEALRNANRELEQLVGARTDELRLALASLESERERERERLARDLHDDLGHLLSCLRLELDLLQPKLAEVDLDASHQLLDRVIASTRAIVAGLRPKALEAQNLQAAIIDLVKETGERYGLHARADVDPVVNAFDPSTAVAVFRILQEAINNVLKHSQAKNLSVSAISKPDWVVLRISDDGKGLPSDTASQGFGLISMRERAQQAGGEFQVISAPERGTRIEVSLPLYNLDKLGAQQ